MKTPESGVWRRTSPVAVLFFLGRILRLIVKNAWQSLAPLIALLVAYQGSLVNKLTFGGIAFAMVLLVGAVLSYWFFRFQVSEDSILIRKGVFKKKQLDIKFDRIQGINTQQNPLYRLLGLVTVSFDTAGSAGSEGNLPAVTSGFAESLRDRIGKSRGTEITGDAEGGADASALVRLNWRDMIRIGLADRRALVLLALLGPLLEEVDDRADVLISDYVTRAAANGIHFDAASGIAIGIAIILAVVLVLAVLSIAAAFLRYHNFELLLENGTLRSNGGLLTRHEHSMELGKIQTLRLQQGVVQRLLNRYRMTARQAISSGKNRGQKVFVVPVVTAELADTLRRKFLAPEAGRLTQDPDSPDFTAISPFYMRSRILFVGLLPAIMASTLFWPELGLKCAVFLLWLPIVALAVYRNWKRAGYLHDDDEIVRRSGLLGYRTVGLLFRKVQRVTVTQSRYQRSKGLASLRMHMASGSVRVPYIDHDRATQLRDYILFKVESSQHAWH
ncbi:MAG: PH domain-containing protein [Gammaproteobacteria bacterium]|nr:PH domain-containing protein [Gammaproteobacteria bacterium]MBU2677764.1 PH domain-containing protein [Gammaproteobacteria bacterium]NNL51497.1 PH domain-containing protein [Woeseiaceae bacterium]